MASIGTARSAIDEALKIIYEGPLYNQVIADSELYSIFPESADVTTDVTTGGRYILNGHLFRLPAGVGARAEGEYLPEADDPVFKNSRTYLRKIQGTLEMTGDTMRRVQNDEGAFLSYADEALPLLSERVASELDRMTIGTGKGILARVNGSPTVVSTTITITLKDTYGIAQYDNETFLQFLDGQRIRFAANADGTSGRSGGGTVSVKVTDFDEANNKIIGTGNNTLLTAIADGDYIFNGDEAGISSVDGNGDNREMQGLLAGVDDGSIVDTYCNIQRTTSGNRLWKSLVIDASSASLGFGGNMSEDLLIYADDIGYTRGMAKVTMLLMNRSAVRGYWKSLKGDRQFIDPRGQYAGGKATDGLRIILGDREVTLKAARKIPPECAFGLTPNTWKRATMGSWKWDDTTGSIWNRVTDSTGRKDQFYATGYQYEELVCLMPRRNWRIDGLNFPQ